MKTTSHIDELEYAILGALINRPADYPLAKRLIDQSSFSSAIRGQIFAAIGELIEQAEVVDEVSIAVQTVLKNAGVEISAADLMKLSLKSHGDVQTYAKLLAEHNMRGDLKTLGSALSQDSGKDVADVIDEARTKLLEISAPFSWRSSETLKDAVHPTLETIEAIQTKKISMIGMSSGFPALDKYLGGFSPGQVYILAGRPSMGKSAFIQRVAATCSESIALFSLEMSTQQIVMRMLSQESGVAHWVIRNGKLNEGEWKYLVETAGKLSRKRVFINDNGRLSIADIESEVAMLVQRHGVKGVIIDYLQLVEMPRAETRDQSIGVVTRRLKELAKTEKIFVIVLSQLNRVVESRVDKRPLLADLRESGNIEQDADVVIFVYRPEYYQIKEVEIDSMKQGSENLACLIIAKNRDGPTGDCWLRWMGSQMLFSRLEEEIKPKPINEETF
jgi:replicative DNA helicase